MKVKTGLHVGMLVALMGVASCSWLNGELTKPCPDPNSCECPTNKNPACAPFPSDAKRPNAGDPR